MKRCGMIEISLKLQGKKNLNGLPKLNLIRIIGKGNCLLDGNMFGVHRVFFSFQNSPGRPNSVEWRGDGPHRGCIHQQGS